LARPRLHKEDHPRFLFDGGQRCETRAWVVRIERGKLSMHWVHSAAAKTFGVTNLSGSEPGFLTRSIKKRLSFKKKAGQSRGEGSRDDIVLNDNYGGAKYLVRTIGWAISGRWIYYGFLGKRAERAGSLQSLPTVQIAGVGISSRTKNHVSDHYRRIRTWGKGDSLDTVLHL